MAQKWHLLLGLLFLSELGSMDQSNRTINGSLNEMHNSEMAVPRSNELLSATGPNSNDELIIGLLQPVSVTRKVKRLSFISATQSSTTSKSNLMVNTASVTNTSKTLSERFELVAVPLAKADLTTVTPLVKLIPDTSNVLGGLLVPEQIEIQTKEITKHEPLGVLSGLLVKMPPVFPRIPNPFTDKPSTVSVPVPLKNKTADKLVNVDIEQSNNATAGKNTKGPGSLVSATTVEQGHISNETFTDPTENDTNIIDKMKYTLFSDDNLQVYGSRNFANTFYEFVFPVITGTCLLTTAVLILFLCRQLNTTSSRMSRASCFLLIAVAVADILTLCFAIAEITYLFGELRRNNNFLPFGSCQTMLVLERLSAIPHAISTWITVILAIQRYLCVSRPFSAGNYITVKSSCFCIMIVCVLTTALHICRFFDKTFKVVSVFEPKNNVTTDTCEAEYAAWVKDPFLYESVFAWTRICLAQLIPSIVIVVFVGIMITTLRRITLASRHMQIHDSKRYSDRRQLSVFVAAIALIVFAIEISSGIFLSLNAWEISTGQQIISYYSLRSASVAFDLILYVSYFAIFLIYCLMSEEIRRKILDVGQSLTCRKQNPDTPCNSSEIKCSESSKLSTRPASTLSEPPCVADYPGGDDTYTVKVR